MVATAPSRVLSAALQLGVSTAVMWLDLDDNPIYVETSKMLGNTLLNLPPVNINVDFFFGLYLKIIANIRERVLCFSQLYPASSL